jgi:hypothetical protein
MKVSGSIVGRKTVSQRDILTFHHDGSRGRSNQNVNSITMEAAFHRMIFGNKDSQAIILLLRVFGVKNTHFFDGARHSINASRVGNGSNLYMETRLYVKIPIKSAARKKGPLLQKRPPLTR